MGEGGPERLSNLPKVTELVGRRAGFAPGGQAAEPARSIFCQGCWAVKMEAQFSKARVGKPWLVHRPKLASATYFCIAHE